MVRNGNGKVGTAKLAIDAGLIMVALAIIALSIVAFRYASSVVRPADTPATESAEAPSLVAAELPVVGTVTADPTADVATSVPTAIIVTASTLPAPQVADGSVEPATVPAGTGYRDPQGRFSFIRPTDWRVLEPQATGVTVQFVSDTPRGNVNVAIQPVPVTTTVDQFASAAVADIQRTYPGYQLDPRGIEPSTLGQTSARHYSFRGDQGGVPIAFTQIVAVKEGIVYVVTLTSAADDDSAFAAQASVVIATFAFHA